MAESETDRRKREMEEFGLDLDPDDLIESVGKGMSKGVEQGIKSGASKGIKPFAEEVAMETVSRLTRGGDDELGQVLKTRQEMFKAEAMEQMVERMRQQNRPNPPSQGGQAPQQNQVGQLLQTVQLMQQMGIDTSQIPPEALIMSINPMLGTMMQIYRPKANEPAAVPHDNTAVLMALLQQQNQPPPQQQQSNITEQLLVAMMQQNQQREQQLAEERARSQEANTQLLFKAVQDMIPYQKPFAQQIQESMETISMLKEVGLGGQTTNNPLGAQLELEKYRLSGELKKREFELELDERRQERERQRKLDEEQLKMQQMQMQMQSFQQLFGGLNQFLTGLNQTPVPVKNPTTGEMEEQPVGSILKGRISNMLSKTRESNEADSD